MGEPEQRPAAEEARVLVVHDDPSFTRDVCSLFAVAGYVSVDAHRHDDALVGIVRGEEYDVILYDVLEGAEEAASFHRQVAVMNAGLAARIVFLSARDLPVALPNPRIVKPVRPDELLAWVTEFLSLRTMPPVAHGEGGPPTKRVDS